MIYKLEKTECAEPLFAGWEETLIWSCLQKVMGVVYADDLKMPESAVAVLGDFWFFAGKPSEKLALFEPKKGVGEFRLMIPQNEAWASVLQTAFGEKAKKTVRYATKKEPGIFDREKLAKMVNSLEEGYRLQLIDEACYDWCREHGWSRDLVSNYENYGRYRDLGIGVAVLKDGIPVAGASSYSSYQNGIEIEIDTQQEYRRQGLATACGAKLILECLGRGLYPSWDAQNRGSLALAEKLGYHFDREYVAFEVFTPFVSSK